MHTVRSTAAAGASDVARALASPDARRGRSHRATSSAAGWARRLRRIAAVVALPALGAGCADSPRRVSGPWDPGAVPPGARLVPTDALVEVAGSPLASYSGIESAEHGVVRDGAAWATLWRRIVERASAPQPLPAVDFSRDMVVYAAVGTRPTGGHSAAVTPIYEAEGAYHVVVTEIRPGPGCATSPALTAAVAVVRAPRWAGEVRFIRRTGTLRCE